MICVSSAPDGKVHVLYDRDCGFCRWSIVQLLALDADGQLDPVAIQSAEGQRLLAGMAPEVQLASAHAVGPTGAVMSGGDAAPLIAAHLKGGRALAAAAAASPPLTRAAYRLVSGNRTHIGRLISAGRRSAADAELAARSRPECA